MRRAALILLAGFLCTATQAAPLIAALAAVPPKPRLKAVDAAPARPAPQARRLPPPVPPADDAFNFFEAIAVPPDVPRPQPRPTRKASAARKQKASPRRKAPAVPLKTSHA